MNISKPDLIKFQNKYNIVDDLAINAIQPNSIDLRIGESFKQIKNVFENGTDNFVVDYQNIDLSYDENNIPSENYYWFAPFSFQLGTTIESVNIPLNLMASIVSRSSIARLGLQIETAGLVDTGFKGQLTLEIFNNSNKWIPVRKRARVAQLVLSKLSTNLKPEEAYQGKYQDQKNATESRIHLDNEFKPKPVGETCGKMRCFK